MKSNKFYLIIFIFLICSLIVGGIFVFNPTKVVSAETTITNDIYGIPDYYLYSALLQEYNYGKNPNEQITELSVDSFADFVTLNLNNKDIVNLFGLDLLNLNNLTTLNLNNNSISSVTTELSNIPALVNLDLSFNSLTTFSYSCLTVGTNVSLITLNLSHNNFSTVNLANFTNVVANLTFNNFSNQQAITFPTSSSATVNISHNNLLGFVDSDLTCNIIKGLQGINNSRNYTTSALIEFFGLPESEELSILQNELVIDTIGIEESVTLPIGFYTLKLSDEPSEELYEDIEITVRPTRPTVELFQNDEKIDYTNTLNKPTIFKFVGDENATFSYTLNINGKITTGSGTEILIENAGIVILKVQQTINGVVSDYETYWLNVSFVSSWAWVYMLLGILIFGALFYTAKIYVSKNSYGSNIKSKKEEKVNEQNSDKQ